MKNKLELFDTVQGWIAIFSGETGAGEMVSEEEAHNIEGESDQARTMNALLVWGAELDDTEISIK